MAKHAPTWKTLAVSAALTVALLIPTAARAGTYTVHACQIPGGGAAPWSGWTFTSPAPESFAADYCPQGKWWIEFMRAARPHAAGDIGQISFEAPADTTIAGYEIWRSVRVLQTSNSTNYSYALLEGTQQNLIESCDGGIGCSGLGDPDNPTATSNLVRREGLRGVRNLWLHLGCRSFFPCEAYGSDSPAKLWLYRASVEIEDDQAPQLTAAPEGSLLKTGTPIAGVATVSVAATDRGGGLREAIAQVDGKVVGRTTLGDSGGFCEPPFTQVVPCALSGSGTIAIDTTDLNDGEHTLQIVITDVAGNSTTWGPTQIRTANACRPGASSSGGARATLAIAAGKRSRQVATTRFGRQVEVTGRLTNASGTPLAEQAVCLGARRGGRLVTLAWARTDSGGNFSAHLPGGPSGKLYAVYRGPAGSSTAIVSVRVRAAVRLNLSRKSLRNGQTLDLEGTVRGGRFAHPPLVELQAWRGPRWQTFGTVRAKRSGHFSFPYRFSRTTGLQHYKLRAHVAAQGGFPYLSGSSRADVVTVRG